MNKMMTIKISEQLDRIESALTQVVTKDEFYVEISRLDSRLEKVETRLDGIEAKVDKIEIRLDNIEAKLDSLEAKVAQIEIRLDNIEARLENLEARLDSFETRLDSFETRLDSFEDRIENLEERYDSLEKITKKIFVKMLSISDGISKIDTIEKHITRLNVDLNQYKDLLVNCSSNYSSTIPFIEKRLDSIDNKVNRFEEEMAIWRIYFNKERP